MSIVSNNLPSNNIMGFAVPMSETEVRKMHLENRVERVVYAARDEVSVVSGPLAGFTMKRSSALPG